MPFTTDPTVRLTRDTDEANRYIYYVNSSEPDTLPRTIEDRTNTNQSFFEVLQNIEISPPTQTTRETVLPILRELKDKLRTKGMHLLTLAGGAPRDLYMKSVHFSGARSVQDYDMYIHLVPTYTQLDTIETRLNDIGLLGVMRLDEEDYDNEDEYSPDSIYYARTPQGLDLNIIIMNPSLTKEDVINNFACSLSKFEWDLDENTITPHKEALLSLATRSLIFKESTRENYKTKITNYFPRFTVCSYRDAVMKTVEAAITKYPRER